MTIDQNALSRLIAKDEIRELAMLYSRGVDRKDIDLLRSLYAKGATDNHGDTYRGSAEGFLEFVEGALAHMHYSGHHICNHLISVNGDDAEGEVYAIAYHLVPDGEGGGMIEDIMCVRYVDRYSREGGRWYFALREVTYDFRSARPVPMPEYPAVDPTQDPSVTGHISRLFARGARA